MNDVPEEGRSSAPPNVEYARRMYDRAIDWYKIAESKAQLILTVNGAFVTITFGLVSGSVPEHGRSRSDDEATYRPEGLWYFGHLATLRWQWVVDKLRAADDHFELTTLTYNVHGLAKIVLRKHRLINAGWTLTSTALIALIAAGASVVIRSQLQWPRQGTAVRTTYSSSAVRATADIRGPAPRGLG